MPESTPTVHRWTITRKATVILELPRAGEAAELARKPGLSQGQLFVWRDRFLEGGQAALRIRRRQIAFERDHQVRELEREGGQLTLENARLKKPDELIR